MYTKMSLGYSVMKPKVLHAYHMDCCNSTEGSPGPQMSVRPIFKLRISKYGV